MKKLVRTPALKLLSCVLPLVVPPVLCAQSVTVLHSFTNTPDGAMIWGGLVQAGQTLYGTARDGGTNSSGMVFAVNTDGSGFRVLHTFTGTRPDGYRPYSGLTPSGDTLYGTTAAGGDTNVSAVAGGTVFMVKTNGTGYQVLHTFQIAEGQFPHGRLVLDGDTFYGTTLGAGATGWGALFSMKTDGSAFSVLHTFTTPVPANGSGSNYDGDQPTAGLALCGGTLYGTAASAGPNASGTVFSVDTNGNNFTILHAFSSTGFDSNVGLTNWDGDVPYGGVAVADGTLYGTTRNGGLQGGGTIFALSTTGGSFSVIHTFTTNKVDGYGPWSGLFVSGNTLYGTTERGGGHSRGTVFSIAKDGSYFQLLASFSSNPDPADPIAGPLLSGNVVYGTTTQGGSVSGGTVFRLDLPAPVITGVQLAGPIVALNATNGMPGRAYALLTSDDVTRGLAQWTPLLTNTVSGSTFSITVTNAVNPAAPNAFFVLRLEP
jgi:uncharacterized repeat protein (TIGR03803 family)